MRNESNLTDWSIEFVKPPEPELCGCDSMLRARFRDSAALCRLRADFKLTHLPTMSPEKQARLDSGLRAVLRDVFDE